ncbi:PD-(D/E)XK nuclease family protein [Pseudomonas aeruginosa]|uniref:RecB family exonuclease n=1 Tax=Pseudomonas aeruginosa TaxID=287 RepID=UPI0003BB5221|nr:PD-(D/E)XK nuclease family protein [Pseudomonas aeruginosa]ELK4895246.1 PD-(D/E)XK nuclease family protein [Pseudomonas aeruginosa]ERX41075.1 hypothetical protein Q010_01838 [Pseudomonas aeruginosa 19660]KSH33158.1 hypothetical protein AO965_05870 [Pseudomonas aeruginosa]KSS33790.1 hypothetical protein APB64_26875 [Pseudomonas aeruginosa]MBD1325363.1 PD-(D/E)XK nuclease family protein [Pseudomonas aeruginosa]
MQTITVRASSWGALFDCGFRWEGVHLLKMRSPSSPRALLGTAIHASTAAFDAARVNGEPISAYDASELLVHTLQQPEFEVDWRGSDISPREAESTGLTLHTKYCNDISPRYDFVAVELTTKPLEIDCGGGILVRLTGQLDRARIKRDSYGVGIADVKTGGAAVSQGVAKTKGHKAQIGTYELLYEHTTGDAITAPAEIIGLKTRGKPEAAVGEIVGARQMMAGTAEHHGLIKFAADMFRSGLFPPNPQSPLCSPKYCPRWRTCPYHE